MQVLVNILSQWPEGETFSIEKIGAPDSFANFIGTFAKKENPGKFLENPVSSHPLFKYFEFVNNLLISGNDVAKFVKHLILNTNNLLTADDAESYLAGLIITKSGTLH